MTRSSPPDPETANSARQTLPALLIARAAASPDAVAQWRLGPGGGWSAVAWDEYLGAVAGLAAGFTGLGLAPGERVGIMAPSSERWDWASLAILAARGVVVGIEPYATADQVFAIASRARPAALVVQDRGLLARFDSHVLADLRFVVLLDGGRTETITGPANVVSFDELALQVRADAVDAWDRSQPDDPAILIFTSGTTGAPKGILYRHRQVRMAIDAILEVFGEVEEGSRFVCWMPLANIFQRILNLCAIARGVQTYYLEDPRQVVQHLPRIEPDVFVGVPRFYEKLLEGINARLDGLPVPVRSLARWAIAVGDAWACAEREKRRCGVMLRARHAVADGLVLGRIRKAVWGGRLRHAVSGSAPMPRWLLEGFHALGLPVLEGYAMSECIVPVASNRPGAYRFGTVGQPMRGNEIRLAEDGELLLRGRGVLDGYYGEERANCPVDADGFLATGDFAQIDRDGFITLTGRKSEVFKTSTGRRVAPVAVEVLLKRLPYVDDAVVCGAGRKSLVAILCLSHACTAGDRQGDGNALQVLLDRLCADIEGVTQPVPAYLRPAGVVLTRRPLSIEGGDLTANLKVRRNAVIARYATLIDELYAALDDPSVQRPFLREIEPGVTGVVGL